MFCPSQIKDYIITGLVSNFFYAPCNRVTFSLQKRNHHKTIKRHVKGTAFFVEIKQFLFLLEKLKGLLLVGEEIYKTKVVLIKYLKKKHSLKKHSLIF